MTNHDGHRAQQDGTGDEETTMTKLHQHPHRARTVTKRAVLTEALAVAVSMAMSMSACAHHPDAPGQSTFEARRQIAAELVARGDWQPAFGYVDQLHREQPNDPRILVLRATIYRERDLLAEAEADLREALRLDSQCSAAHAALGILLDRQRRAADAEEQHRAAVKLEPRNAAYLNNLGFSLFLHGKVKDAIPYYEQAARLAPTTRRTRTNLGFAYAARGDLQRAAHEFAMGGTPAEAKTNLGFAYERRGDMANAYEQYLEAARLDPHSRRARLNLAHAAALTGHAVPSGEQASETSSETPVVDGASAAWPGAELAP
ncbi:MAG: tetratricopeptide repeat protein [Myxococcales bacterium]